MRSAAAARASWIRRHCLAPRPGCRILSDDFDVRSDVTYLTWLSPTTCALKEQRTLEIKAPGLPEKLGASGKLDVEASGGSAGNQPAQQFIKFSAQATCQVVPGRGYRILDMKPGTFE